MREIKRERNWEEKRMPIVKKKWSWKKRKKKPRKK